MADRPSSSGQGSTARPPVTTFLAPAKPPNHYGPMWPRPHPRPPLQLSRLRDIGWSLWDPIGLLDPGDTWDWKPFADEYDSYLPTVASMLRDGHSTEECEAYLVEIAVIHMGLGVDKQGNILPDEEKAARDSAKATVAAILAYVAELDADYLGGTR